MALTTPWEIVARPRDGWGLASGDGQRADVVKIGHRSQLFGFSCRPGDEMQKAWISSKEHIKDLPDGRAHRDRQARRRHQSEVGKRVAQELIHPRQGEHPAGVMGSPIAAAIAP